MPVRIGVIGTADIARRRMIPAIRHCPAFEYAGVAVACSSEWEDPHSDNEYTSILEHKKAKAKSFCDEFGGNSYIGYESLLQDESVDAVYIPLPPSLHYKWGKLALQYGKHVLMEKPFTVSREQTDELLAIAEQRNLAVIENYGFIYHSQFKKIKEIYDGGEIGTLREIRASFGFPHRELSDFRYSRKYGGGALLDCGGYTIKAACEFMKVPEVVYVSLVTPDQYEVDLYGSVVLQDFGTTAHLSFGMDNAYKCDFELWGSEGSVSSYRAYTAPADFESSILLSTSAGKKEITCGRCNQFMETLRAFHKLIGNNGCKSSEYDAVAFQSKIMSSICFFQENR